MNKHTERVIRDIIDEFEAEVRRLLDEGHTDVYKRQILHMTMYHLSIIMGSCT